VGVVFGCPKREKGMGPKAITAEENAGRGSRSQKVLNVVSADREYIARITPGGAYSP